jgi:hypothetical protein
MTRVLPFWFDLGTELAIAGGTRSATCSTLL